MATTLELLREHGPAGPAFRRFGRTERQPLLDAIGTPAGMPPSPAAVRPPASRNGAVRSRKLWHGRRGGRCARNAGGSSQTTGGRPCSDWSQSWPSHPHLCKDCESRAVAAEQQAEADERERQEQEAEQVAQKRGGWLSHFRA
ncbi:hypothetical protein [Streptomyces sp. NPDC058424]|uniref:hypothetical protein n=1 Tax=Streptomyces sp. NPDC058424 TaxID=3346491 RepID=UPI00364D67B3